MICIECNSTAKYKCPTCITPYCSVRCYKVHKSTPCSPPAQQPKQPQDIKSNVNYEYPTEDTVTVEELKVLDDSKEVRQCLANAHLRDLLKLLDQAPNPDTIIKNLMQEPIFTEFVDACLSIVQEKHGNDGNCL